MNPKETSEEMNAAERERLVIEKQQKDFWMKNII